MEKIRYSTSNMRNKKATKQTPEFDVSNEEIVLDIIQLSLILYTRLENPKCAKSLPVITRIPQLLSSISEEKKLAIASLSQTRGQVICEINSRMKEMYFTHFDKYMFERSEKELAWLLIKANTTKECLKKLNTSESQFRYSIKKMCSKTKTKTKGEMVSKLRDEIEKC